MTTVEQCIEDAFTQIESSKVRTEVGIMMITEAEAKRIVSEAVQCLEVKLLNNKKETHY